MYKLSDFREVLMEQAVCNFHCQYCHSGFGDNSNCHGLRLNFNKEWWEKNVELDYTDHIAIWGGEPFANFNILKDLVDYLNPYVGTFTLICNGSLFDLEKAKWCIENRVRVHFSHDLSDQYIRGKDFLKDDKFWEACEYMQKNHKPLFKQPEWKISLQKVLHAQSSSFEEDLKYIETLPKEYKWNFSFAIQRGNTMPDRFAWKADTLLSYFHDVLEYIENKGPYAKYIFGTFIKRHFRCWLNIPNKYPCGAMNSTSSHMKSIGVSGVLHFCHANSEFDRGIKFKEECKTCEWSKCCMASCAVMDQKIPCSEWKKLHRGMYNMINSFVNRVCPGTPNNFRIIRQSVEDYLNN